MGDKETQAYYATGPEDLDRIVLGRIGEQAAGVPAGAEGVDLSLLMPDFDARMGSVGANLVAGRIESAMGVSPALRSRCSVRVCQD